MMTDSKRLESFGYKIYSQNDEDGIINEIFRRLNIYKGNFVEIGVGSGVECNTHYLLLKGWSGIWIDDNFKNYPVDNKFSGLIEKNRLKVINEHVTTENINTLVNGELDFLSIDVDGMDIHLLSVLKAKPKVICIEYNKKFQPPLSVTPVYDPDYKWNGNWEFGASLTAIENVATKNDYTLVGTNITGVNAFFVRNDLVNDLFCIGGAALLYNPQ